MFLHLHHLNMLLKLFVKFYVTSLVRMFLKNLNVLFCLIFVISIFLLKLLLNYYDVGTRNLNCDGIFPILPYIYCEKEIILIFTVNFVTKMKKVKNKNGKFHYKKKIIDCYKEALNLMICHLKLKLFRKNSTRS